MPGSTQAVAAVLTAPRTLELREFPLPQIGADDGLLRIEACGLCGTDWEQYTGAYDRGRPMIPGHEIIGTIDRIGKDAAARWGVREGDRVALDASVPCGTCRECTAGAYKRCPTKLGYGMHVKTTIAPGLWGGYATHAYLHPRSLLFRLPSQAEVPTNVMTLFNPLSNAVSWAIEVGGVGLGGSIVICGPGQRGLLAVVAARGAGAETIVVTGTAHDRYRLEMARALGATATIDSDAEDPVARVRELTGGALVDVVLDVTGATAPIAQAIQMVRPGGKVVLAGIKGHHTLDGLLTDTIVHKEIQILGVRSSGPSATEKAIRIIRRDVALLAPLCTHAYNLPDATTAVLVLGREHSDGREAIHVHLNGNT